MNLLISIIIVLALDALLFFALRFISPYYGGNEVIIFDHKVSEEEKKFLKSCFFTYLLWGAAQQAVIIGLFYLLCLCLPVWVSIVIVCILFMMFHFPNVVLMFAVLGMEMILLSLYYVAGLWFIPFMALTHGLLATCLLFMFPESIHANFKCWIEFFKYYKPRK